MAKFTPKTVSESSWKKLSPDMDYAIRSNPGEDIQLKFGLGGFYITITHLPQGRFVNEVRIDDGELSVLGKINDGAKLIFGRGSDCSFKIPHAVMSRHHLELIIQGNIVLAKDMGSTNGTFCWMDNQSFNIEDYIAKHDPNEAAGSTMDVVREAFGPSLDDFLKKYKETKESNK